MKRWYVLQVYAGFEEQVKIDLMRRIKEEQQEELFGEILIPSAKVKRMFEATQEENAQLFPGYVLIEMELTLEAIRLVTVNPRIIRFLGGKNPTPLQPHEVERVIKQMKGEMVMPTIKSEFIVGNEVDIKEGPFAGFVGIIDKIDEENERLTVMVSIFGRMTPVELSFSQIKR